MTNYYYILIYVYFLHAWNIGVFAFVFAHMVNGCSLTSDRIWILWIRTQYLRELEKILCMPLTYQIQGLYCSSSELPWYQNLFYFCLFQCFVQVPESGTSSLKNTSKRHIANLIVKWNMCVVYKINLLVMWWTFKI